MKRFWLALGATALLFIAGAVGGYIAYSREADASRNSAGTMSAVNGPYVPSTVINSSQINSRYSDIEAEITSSLDRSGRGGMLSALRGIDGTVAAPALSWTSETGSGLYRIGSSDVGFAISGAKKLELTSSLFTVTPNVAFSGFVSGTLGIGAVSPDPANALYVTGSGPQFAVESRAGINTRLVSNANFNSTDKYTATGFAGMLQLAGLTSADFVFYTAPSGTGGNSVTFTERLKVNESGTTFSTGIGGDGSGLKHQAHTGCATAASIGATCTDTLTWSTAFAATTVAAYCFCNAVTSGLPIIRSYTDPGNGVSITITTMALTAAAAQCSVIKCLAIPE